MDLYSIDSLLNNRQSYDQALEQEMNKKLAPYVTLSQFTSGVKPDSSMAAAIAEKSSSIQKAIAAENKKREANALADLDSHWATIYSTFLNPYDPFDHWLGAAIYPYNYDSDGQDPPTYYDFGNHFDPIGESRLHL